LRDELHRKNLSLLAEEDFTRLCHVNGREPTPKEDLVWRVNGVRDLSPSETAILQELCLWRDELAEKMKRPVFKVVNDSILVALAQDRPRDEYQLRAGKMTDRQINRFGQGVLAAIARGVVAPPLYPPTYTRPDDDYLERVEALSDWRKQRARAIGVESDVILPREHIAKIARHNPVDESSLSSLMEDVPWRFEQYAHQILDVLERMNR
jgi:ribonuclease D